MPKAAAKSENAPHGQEQHLEPGPHPRAQHLGLQADEADVVRDVVAPEDRGVGQQRREQDRHEGHQHEGGELLEVGEPPPAPPAAKVLLRGQEDVSGAGLRHRLAGHRAHQARRIDAHAVALVADPVGLDEVLAAARAGVGERAEQEGEAELLGGDARVGHHLGQGAPGRRFYRHEGRDHQQGQHGRDLQHLGSLERHIDHRRKGQDQADRHQHADRDPPGLAADHVGEQGRRTGRPARP
ncbi:hypothetical protein LRS04_24770 [Phenylobacterium sp. J367]|nr:hypothetical protein [Phenylobacterium sp. J367]MCR5881115.1 hypothetical protein [Phenylobacterium sp. J367]